MPSGDATTDAITEELARLKQRMADGAGEAAVDATAKDLAFRAAKRHVELESASRDNPDEANDAALEALDEVSHETAEIRSDIVSARLARGEPARGLPPGGAEGDIEARIGVDLELDVPGPMSYADGKEPQRRSEDDPSSIESQVQPMMAGEHNEQVVLGGDPDAPEQLTRPIESQVQPMMAGEHNEQVILGGDPDAPEQPVGGSDDRRISTKTLIRGALALFGATAVGLGAYVFATGGDDEADEAPTEADAGSGTETRAADELDNQTDAAGAAGAAAPAGTGTSGIRGELNLEIPVVLSASDLATERESGAVAPPGAPFDGIVVVTDLMLTEADEAPSLEFDADPPLGPWFFTMSWADGDDLVLEASLVDGGAGPIGELVVFGEGDTGGAEPLRFVQPDVDVRLSDELIVFDLDRTIELPPGLRVNEGGEFDVFLTVGSSVDGTPSIQRHPAGLVEVAPDFFAVDESLVLITFEEVRRTGLAGAPAGVADCILETVPFDAEILGFLDGTLGQLSVPCLFSASPLGESAAAGLTGFAADERAAVSCIGNGLALRAVTAEDVGALALPWEEWPEGLLETYAAVLEDCVPLEPFYLARFGAFEYTRGGCPEAMTAYVLDRYSWQRFIVEGIISPDTAERDAARARFEADVNAGYPLNDCFLA